MNGSIEPAVAEPPTADPHLADRPSQGEVQGARTPLRLRSDLRPIATYHHGRRYWLIRDPLARRVVRLTEADYQQLQQIEAADPGLVAEAAEQQLLQGYVPTRNDKPRGSFNPFYIRLPGVDADRMLGWLVPRTRWLFSGRALLFWGSVIALAIIMVLTQIRQFTQSLPSFHTFFGPQNWLPLAVAMIVTKIIHECAHGIVCRRFGARCPEIGVLLLCGTPCMYCDVTDSWALPNRWQRAAVMLAGVYVEAVLAAVATLIWWFAREGPVYYGCMNLMFVCGVSTLLFNLNPLMRFDGYYVLSDVLNLPNMRGQAAAAWRSVVVAPLAGDAYRNALQHRPRGARGLSLFHAASTLWRLMAVGGIACWVFAVADNARLRPLGYVLAGGLVAAAVIPIFRSWTRVARGHAAWQGVRPVRRLILLSGLAAGLLAIFAVPLPRRIAADGFVDFAHATTVYVRSEGRVEDVQVDYGQRVGVGQPILQLQSPRLLNEQIQLVSQSAEARLQVASLRRRALSDPELMEQWDSQQATAESLQQRVEFVQRQVEQLAIHSAAAGTILPLIDAKPIAAASLGDLLGQHLPEGTKLCRIGDPNLLEVILELDAAARADIQPGSRVRIQFEQNGIGVVESQVAAISEIHQTQADAETKAAEKFQIICNLPATTTPLAGTRVKAKVTATRESLAQKISRTWRATF